MRKRSRSWVWLVTVFAAGSGLAPGVGADARGGRTMDDPFRSMIMAGRGFGPAGTIATASTDTGTIFLQRNGMTVLSGTRMGRLRFVGAERPTVTFGPRLPQPISIYAGCSRSTWIGGIDLHGWVRLSDVYPGFDFVMKRGSNGTIRTFFEATRRADLSAIKLASPTMPEVVDGDLNLGRSSDALTIRPPSADGEPEVAWRIDGRAAAVAPIDTILETSKRLQIPLLWNRTGDGLDDVEWSELERTADGFVGAGVAEFEAGGILWHVLGANPSAAAVARFDDDGTPRSLTYVATADPMQVDGLAVGADGQAIVGGSVFQSCFPEPARGLPVQVGHQFAYAFGLHADGLLAWGDVFGRAGVVRDVAVAPDGTVALVGEVERDAIPQQRPVLQRRDGACCDTGFLVRRAPDGAVLDSSALDGARGVVGIGHADDRFTIVGTYRDAGHLATGGQVRGRAASASVPSPKTYAGDGFLFTHEIPTHGPQVSRTSFLEDDSADQVWAVDFDNSGDFVTHSWNLVDQFTGSTLTRFDRAQLAPSWEHEIGPLFTAGPAVAAAENGGAWIWVAPSHLGSPEEIPLFWGLRGVDAAGDATEEVHGSRAGVSAVRSVAMTMDGDRPVLLGRFGMRTQIRTF